MTDDVARTDLPIRAEIASNLLAGIFAHQPTSFTTNQDSERFAAEVSQHVKKAVVAADILLKELAK